MNKLEYESLSGISERVVSAADLADRTPRTLLYGYTTARLSFHVYLDTQGLIHCVCYDSRRLLISHSVGPSGGVQHNAEFVPDKRLYPESCDFEFCALLARQRVGLPFTTFDEQGHAKRTVDSLYAGLTVEQLTPTARLTYSELDLVYSSAAGIALLTQAATELGVQHEQTYGAVNVDARHVGAVLERAKSLSEEPAVLALESTIDHPDSAVKEHLRQLAPYQMTTARSSSVLGGTLQGQYSLEHPLDMEDLARRGFAAEALSDKAIRLRGKEMDVVLVQMPGPAGRGSTDGFLFQHLFGSSATFERALRPYLGA